MKISVRKAFTMIEMLIVIVIISILAAMLLLGIDEFIVSAKARVIVGNLHTMKKAVNEWYAAHSNMVYKKDGKNYVINYQNKGIYPIQELWEERSGGTVKNYTDNPIGTKNVGAKSFLGKYLENPDILKASGTTLSTDKNFYSPMIEDGYLLHDNDTSGGVGRGATTRTAWYAGYTIPMTSQGEKIKKKLASMAKSQGLLQDNRKTTSDNAYRDSQQVWMMIIDFGI